VVVIGADELISARCPFRVCPNADIMVLPMQPQQVIGEPGCRLDALRSADSNAHRGHARMLSKRPVRAPEVSDGVSQPAGPVRDRGSIREIPKYLEDLEFPAERRDIMDHLLASPAPAEVIAAADRMPDKTFEDIDDLTSDLADT